MANGDQSHESIQRAQLQFSPAMSPIAAKVVAFEKRDAQYQLVVEIIPKYRGSFNILIFGEIRPHTDSLKDGRLDLVDHLLVSSADNFGGAGGKGNYMTVDNSKNDAVNPTTLTLTAPQRYFGFWWSAGDAKDVISFYSGNTLDY